ncbi:MAG: threonine synthase [Pseudomonadales bacterium]|nr:threonine synthase [Pseudomonadales bacterium]
MKYVSTRGKAPVLNFEEVLLAGLASDGGLYVPETYPQFSHEDIASWSGLSYSDVAIKVISPFVAGCITQAEMEAIIRDTYTKFRHPAVTTLLQLNSNEWVLELFHGPTLAFKDVALQLLGRLLDAVLAKRHERVVIMGATSGDTGSAAIEGCRRCENIDIFILHPHQRVSEVQRRQMTTVLAPNIHNIAVQGNFDDCQQMVKDSFADQSFLNGKPLVAVNSINWARIMAQVVYYFYAAVQLGAPHRAMQFSVPTGNFGDIFAGYVAKRMGLPIAQLIIATNRNDILHRFMSGNRLEKTELMHTLSPSMDIMISSNFERMLFELHDRDGAAIDQLMADFKSGAVSIDAARFAKACELFSSLAVDDGQTCKTIADVLNESEYLLDPHSAIGVEAARRCKQSGNLPVITLATAHPAKFPEAVCKAGYPQDPPLPLHMKDLFEREERCVVLPKDLQAVQQFMTANIRD